MVHVCVCARARAFTCADVHPMLPYDVGPLQTGVGIRFKGFFGSLRMCLLSMMGECSKLSYKLKFDHVDPDARFFGLKMLQLHAAGTDTSKMRERLTYGLFREMGVPAPRSSFSDVEITVGGSANSGVKSHSTTLGVHLLTEVIDGECNRIPTTFAFQPKVLAHSSLGGAGTLY